MTIGDRAQYNKQYNPHEVVTILKIKDDHALIQFPSGTKIVTRITGLWPLEKVKHKAQLKLF